MAITHSCEKIQRHGGGAHNQILDNFITWIKLKKTVKCYNLQIKVHLFAIDVVRASKVQIYSHACFMG